MAENTNINVLRRIEDLTGNVAKDYTNISLIHRGAPQFFDENLRGTVRFASRFGNFLPLFTPDNATTLAADVTPPINTFFVTSIPDGLDFGSLLSVGPGLELAKVADFDTVTGQITAVDDLLGTHEAGISVDLFGVAAEIAGSYVKGSTTLFMRTTKRVMNGDQIALETSKGLLNSIVSIRVLVAQFISETEGVRDYQLVLDEGIPRSLVDEEEIFLRAQAGYESPVLRIRDINGPFVIDYLSGDLYDDVNSEEFLSVRVLDSLGSPLPGFSSPVTVGKNFAVVNMPINKESMLFWDVIRGSVSIRNGKFIAITDDTGLFVLSQYLVPGWSAGVEWDIPILSDASCLVRVKFEPNEYRDFSVPPGILQRIRVGSLASEAEATRIEVVVSSDTPGTIVEFNNWSPVQPTAHSLVYYITSTAFGDSVWQASSLMLKPYSFTLDDIRARLDFSGLNQGSVHF